MTEEELKVIVKGIDQGATKVAKEVGAEVSKVGKAAMESVHGVDKLSGALKGLGGWVKAGFGAAIGAQALLTIENILGSLVGAFSDAVAGGQAWADTVRGIERVTGMTAIESSELAAVLQRIGVPLGSLQQMLSQTGVRLLENEALWKRAGIATRDANGDYLSTYTILGNLRRAFSDHSAALQASGLIQELVGRNGYKFLEFLQLTDEQYKALVADAAAAGQILTAEQTRQAELMERLHARVQGAVTGLQSAIFQGVAPGLMQFVDAFASWITSHMQQIVAFVAQVANYIMGVIGGLFGLDFAAETSAEAVDNLGDKTQETSKSFADWLKTLGPTASGMDAVTKAINGQIKAIDRQIDAIQRRMAARHAEDQRAQLMLSLAQARAQLADLRGAKPFTAGLSNAERVLAEQKHAQDIIDAEGAVSDAKSDLAMFDADGADRREMERLNRKKASLQEELAAHREQVKLREQFENYLVGVNQQADDQISTQVKNLYEGITADAKKWRDQGVAFANDLKKAIGAVVDALLGPEMRSFTPGQGFSSTRTGGLMGALGSVGEAIGWLAGVAAGAAKLINDALGWLTAPVKELGGKSLWDYIAAVSGAITRGPFGGWQDAWDTLQPTGPGKATGGRVQAGVRYPVGELGKEWFVPGVDGRIVPDSVTGQAVGLHPVIIKLEIDGHEITEVVDRRLYLKASNVPVGIRGFAG